MTCKKFAVACVAAALSLAITSLGSGASAADGMAPPPLDIHGFFDVTFSNDYMTPRGLLVTNTGLTTQIVSGLTFSLYKNPNAFINSFSITAGTFNDLWSQQNNVQVGSWNEFDWWVSADIGFANYWKAGVTYITFLSPPGNFRQERNVEPYIRFDDGALTAWASPSPPTSSCSMRSPVIPPLSSATRAIPMTSKSAWCQRWISRKSMASR